MINFIKGHLKVSIIILSIVILGLISILTYKEKDETILVEKEEKLAVKEDKKEEKEPDVSTVFVDIKGAVNAPGVYEIDSTKRVIDAINLAGGLTSKADTINLNLSKKVEDEMYIVVYTKTELYEYKKKNTDISKANCASLECECPDSNNSSCINKEEGKTTSNIPGKVSLNTATKEELMSLSGIGEAKASAIITYRNENGKFKSVEDVKNVSGIGDSLFEQIKNNIVL